MWCYMCKISKTILTSTISGFTGIVFLSCFLFIASAQPGLSAQANQKTIQVSQTQQLYAALRHANKFGYTHIVLADGMYNVHKTLLI